MNMDDWYCPCYFFAVLVQTHINKKNLTFKMIVDIVTMSVRGQVSIPIAIREQMGLKQGERVFFVLEKNVLVMRKLQDLPWDAITAPLRNKAKKANLEESEVSALVRQVRKRA